MRSPQKQPWRASAGQSSSVAGKLLNWRKGQRCNQRRVQPNHGDVLVDEKTESNSLTRRVFTRPRIPLAIEVPPIGDNSMRFIEAFGRIILQNENVELARTEVVTVDCRKVIQRFNQPILKSDYEIKVL